MTFRARYDGRCSSCHNVIEVGDILEWSDENQAVHLDCAHHDAELTPRPTCPTCWIELPLTGTCGVCE